MILVTGGLGYIGSHIASQLVSQGREVLLVDNLSNSHIQVLERLEYIHQRYIPFIKMDIRNTPALSKVFEQYQIDTVIHCAGFKSFSESRSKPLEYYNDNLNCILSLLRSMQRAGIRNLVHISSLMVYGQSSAELDEKVAFNYQCSNPYVRSLQMVEDIIKDACVNNTHWNIAVLRLANVAGACEHGVLGEMVAMFPKNIIPIAMQVAARQREFVELHHYGTANPEGTVERNFLHVLDASDAVCKTLTWLDRQEYGLDFFNVSGNESIHMQKIINEISRVTQRAIPTVEVKSPDAETFLQLGAKNFKAHCTLQWRAVRGLNQILEDQWRFYQSTLPK
ncbi:MAG: SDR family NAD(P)-dependent oxidoreductase [Acinetobacter sp.]|nr:SDR family NAD(P)-dependent oxidoreductase [Acinetobacter sp.]